MSTTPTRVYNFSPGPATLPTSVLQQVQSELLDYQASGMSLIELSHRGPVFEKVYHDSLSRLRNLAAIPEGFDILYMTGGASTQFALVPLNLSSSQSKPLTGYVNTGSWSQKAIAQAKIQGIEVHLAGSSEDQNFNYIPEQLKTRAGLDYLHITSNNTIFGTQYKGWPTTPSDSHLIIDMSSDFLSRAMDWENIGLVYAGAQKNAGPAGLSIVIIDREYYNREKESTPSMFRYSTFAKSQSMYNTPPTFQIYVFALVLEWIEGMGGLEGIAKHNSQKAQLIYDILDKYPHFYKGYARKKDRSLMNITWNFPEPKLDKLFLEGAAQEQMRNLKGHRSVGGLRASLYNAMSMEGCEKLAEYMEEFYRNHR